jgi:hypothetical protein
LLPIAAMHDLSVGDKEMSQVINALKTNGLIQGNAAKLVDRMPRIRDCAMHANWGSITPVEVGMVVACVEQLLAVHF